MLTILLITIAIVVVMKVSGEGEGGKLKVWEMPGVCKAELIQSGSDSL